MRKISVLLLLLSSCVVKESSHNCNEDVIIDDEKRYFVRIDEDRVISVDELVHLVQEYEYKLY